MGWNTRDDIRDAINSSGVIKEDSYYFGYIIICAFWVGLFYGFERFFNDYIPGGLTVVSGGVSVFIWLVARIIYGEIATAVVYLVGIILFCAYSI